MALESQVKHTEDELTATCSEYELRLAEERQQNEQAVARITREKEAELSKAKEKLKRLDGKVAELQALLKQSMNSPPPSFIVDPSTPPTTKATKKPKPKEKETTVRTLQESRERSASFNDLTTVDVEQNAKKKSDRKLSTDVSNPHTNTEKRSSIEKRSITELVAESLLNPSSMAAIRQELKSDNLTPKIQRKLKNHANQTTLPSLSNGPSPSSGGQTDKSPRIKERGSPKGGSPITRPRWD